MPWWGAMFPLSALKVPSSACVESPWRSNVAPTGGREIRISSVRRPGESEGGHGDAFAANDASDDPSLNVGTQGADHVLRILLRRDEGEAHSHVKVWYISLLSIPPSWARARRIEGGSSGSEIRNSTLDLRRTRFRTPPPVMCAIPCTAARRKARRIGRT